MPLTSEGMNLKTQAAFDDDLINVRLNAASQAQTRSRLVLAALGIACASISIACYNAYLSFGYCDTLDALAKDPSLLGMKDEKGNYVPVPTRDFSNASWDALMRHDAESWVDSRYVSVSLLGIKVSVDDAPEIGTAALFIISIWLMLSVRRENRTICSLLSDTIVPRGGKDRAPDVARQWRVYHGIVSHSVFSTYRETLAPAPGLAESAAENEGCDGPGVTACVSCQKHRWRCTWKILQWGIISSLVYGVFLLPILTSLFSFALDVHSCMMRSYCRAGLAIPSMSGFMGVAARKG